MSSDTPENAGSSSPPPATPPSPSGSDPRPRIKIGTQRPGVEAPRVEPRVKFVVQNKGPAAPDPQPTPPADAPSRPLRQTSPDAPTRAESAAEIVNPGNSISARPAPAPASAPAGTNSSASAPVATVSSGPENSAPQPMSAESATAPATAAGPMSAQPAAAEPRAASAAMSPADRVPSAATATARIETGAVRPGQAIPKPNLRAALSPELQQEMDEALGDLSLENMLGGGGAAAPVADQIEMDSTRQAKVLSISRDLVFVDLGSRNQGFIPLKQFATPPAAGAQLEVRVSRFDPEEGLYELTLPHGTVSVADWSQVHEGMVVEARITGHNKGGLECEVNNLRGFMPISQISLYRVENIEQFVGQRWPCLITEANPERRNLLLSRRAVLEQEQQEAKEKIFGELAVGQVREGVVRSLRDFGAFVDLGGIDGLIHIGQMSWDRVKHPSDVLEIGQKVKVKIEKIDPDTRKIGLSYRDLTENPWTHAGAKYIVGSAVKGTVSRIMDFGAFVKLEPGIEGLVHISEIAYGRVFRVGDFLKEGQEVEAKVLSVDADAQRISLSIKALMAKPMPVKKDEPELPEEPETPPAAPAKRKVPLKGGLGRGSGGGQVGLNW